MLQESATGRADTATRVNAGVEATSALTSTMPTGQGDSHQTVRDAASRGKEAGEATSGSGLAVQDDSKGKESAAQHACQHVPVIEWWQEGQRGFVAAQRDAQSAPAADWMHYYRGGTGGLCLPLLAAAAQPNSAARAATAARKVEHGAGGEASASVTHERAGASSKGAQEGARKRQRGSGAAQSAQQGEGGHAGSKGGREGIRRARLRQDLERRAAEEAALLSWRFRACPVPQSSARPRWAVASCTTMPCPLLLPRHTCACLVVYSRCWYLAQPNEGGMHLALSRPSGCTAFLYGTSLGGICAGRHLGQGWDSKTGWWHHRAPSQVTPLPTVHTMPDSGIGVISN